MPDNPTYVIYHKETCSKCRTLKQHMEEKKAFCTWIAYLQQPPDEATLTNLIDLSGLDAKEFVRRNEPLFTKKYAGKKRSKNQWVKLLVKHPELLQRPIVRKGNRVWIARDEDTIQELMNS